MTFKAFFSLCFTYILTSLGTTMSLVKFRLHPGLLLWIPWTHITWLYMPYMLYIKCNRGYFANKTCNWDYFVYKTVGQGGGEGM